jgi:general L-amino acid transport system substrate-binding protein
MKNTKLFRLLAALLAISLIAAACGSDAADESAEGGGDEAAETDADTLEDSSDDDAGSDSDDGGDDDDTEAVDLAQGSLLDEVIARGTLNCGVSGAGVGFSTTNADGRMVGFDADYCRAVAAAVLGDAEAVNFVELTAAERFTAIQTGDADVLMRNTTWTQSRDTDVGMDFGPTTYFDGQQLMASAASGFSSASTVADIDGAVVCTNAGTTTEKNISDAAAAAGVTITLNTFEDFDIVTDNFIQGACDIITTDGSALVGRKSVNEPNDWVIFPGQPISKEPLGPTYRQNDSAWADVINWTVYATLIADEKGVNSGNVDDMLANGDAEIQRLLGGEGELQTVMGLSADAFYQVIAQVGNYGEIFNASLPPLGVERAGANTQWTDGGLLYAPPAR